MIKSVQVFEIHCDGCGTELAPSSDGAAWYASIEIARHEAEMWDWTTDGTKDHCPECPVLSKEGGRGMNEHILVRTNPRGEKFIGECIVCGATELTFLDLHRRKCPVVLSWENRVLKIKQAITGG